MAIHWRETNAVDDLAEHLRLIFARISWLEKTFVIKYISSIFISPSRISRTVFSCVEEFILSLFHNLLKAFLLRIC